MTPLRRVLAPLTAIWLTCQIGTVALVPVALWVSTADPHAAECTCQHGGEATCPMHHKPAAPTRCAMQNANESGTAALTSLSGILGLIPEQASSLTQALAPTDIPSADDHPIGVGVVPPDPPPPRA
jgi:hypothetical protein